MTPEHALLGLVRGKVGSLAGPRGHYGHALAVETAVEVARAGGQVLLITPQPPDNPPEFDGRFVVDYCPSLPETGADWHRYLHYSLLNARRGAQPELLLVVIDQAIEADAVSVMQDLAEWHSVAIAYLPRPMIVSPEEVLARLARAVDDDERGRIITEVRHDLIMQRPRSAYSHWTKEQVESVLQPLDREVMLWNFRGLKR